MAPLQRAWRQNGRRWIERHGQRRAGNVGYMTANVPVPIDELMVAMVKAMFVN